MIDFVDVSIDILTAALAVGTGFVAILIRGKFKESILWKPWRILASSPFVLAAAEANHIYEDFVGSNTLAYSFHVVLEAGFVLMLFYGFYLLYKAWVPSQGEEE